MNVVLRACCITNGQGRPVIRLPKHSDIFCEPLRPCLEAKLGEVIDKMIEKGMPKERILKRLRSTLSEVANAIFLDIVLDRLLDQKTIELNDIKSIPRLIQEMR